MKRDDPKRKEYQKPTIKRNGHGPDTDSQAITTDA
jgi:hypothetical protein